MLVSYYTQVPHGAMGLAWVPQREPQFSSLWGEDSKDVGRITGKAKCLCVLEFSSASKQMDDLEQICFPLRQTPPSSRAKPGCCLPFSQHLGPPGEPCPRRALSQESPPKGNPTSGEPPHHPILDLYPCPRRGVVPLPTDGFRQSSPMGSKGKSAGMPGGSHPS